MPQRKKYNDHIASFTALIVEDEIMVALDLELLLVSLGATDVETVASAKAAEAVLRSKKFDLCVMDSHLDDGTSARAAQTAIASNIPLVFMTGDPALCHKLQACDHPHILEKPFSHHDVKLAVAHVLGTELPESSQDQIRKAALCA